MVQEVAGASQRKSQIIMSCKIFYFFFKIESSKNIIWKKKEKKKRKQNLATKLVVALTQLIICFFKGEF